MEPTQEALIDDLRMYRKLKKQLKAKAQEYSQLRAVYQSVIDSGDRSLDKPRHGYNFLVGAESKAEKRLAIMQELRQIRTQFRRLDFIMCRLLDVLRLLDGDEYRIISMRFIEGRSWQYVAIEAGYDISTIHRKKKKALARIAPLYNLSGIDEYAALTEIAAPQDRVLFPHSAGASRKEENERERNIKRNY